MQSELLTGSFTAERVAALSDDGRRHSAPAFTTDLGADLALAAALEPITHQHGVSVAAVVVTWTLSWSCVTAAIGCARRPGQVDGWITSPRGWS